MEKCDGKRAYQILMNLYAEQEGVIIEYTLECDGEVTHHRTGRGNVSDKNHNHELRKGA